MGVAFGVAIAVVTVITVCVDVAAAFLGPGSFAAVIVDAFLVAAQGDAITIAARIATSTTTVAKAIFVATVHACSSLLLLFLFGEQLVQETTKDRGICSVRLLWVVDAAAFAAAVKHFNAADGVCFL